MSIAIIANPLAGRGRGQKTAQLTKKILTNQNIDFQLLFSEYAGHAIELAEKASEKHEVVVALGGDGTIREVLEGTWQKAGTLGIIPAGTGNDYTRGLGIPRETGPAIEVLLEGNTTRFDVGMENDRVFGQMTSIGFSVDVIDYVNKHRDGIWKGSIAFLAGIVATLRDLRTYPIRITIDGKTFEKDVVAVFSMNMPYGGGGMQFIPDARYDSGLLHVLLIEHLSKMSLGITLPKIYSGKHLTHPAVTVLTGRDIQIESKPLPLMIDGDIFPPRTFNTKIIPQAKSVLVPKTPAQ